MGVILANMVWLWVIKWSSWWLYLAPLDSVGGRGALYTLMEVSWERLGLSGVHWGSLELNQDQWSLVGGYWGSKSVIGVLCGSVGFVVVLWLNGSHWAHWRSLGPSRGHLGSLGLNRGHSVSMEVSGGSVEFSVQCLYTWISPVISDMVVFCWRPNFTSFTWDFSAIFYFILYIVILILIFHSL